MHLGMVEVVDVLGLCCWRRWDVRFLGGSPTESSRLLGMGIDLRSRAEIISNGVQDTIQLAGHLQADDEAGREWRS